MLLLVACSKYKEEGRTITNAIVDMRYFPGRMTFTLQGGGQSWRYNSDSVKYIVFGVPDSLVCRAIWTINVQPDSGYDAVMRSFYGEVAVPFMSCTIVVDGWRADNLHMFTKEKK